MLYFYQKCTNRDLKVCAMERIINDPFYEHIKQYDPDSEYHLVGEVDYHLLCDDKPYEGISSHREALRSVFDRRAEKAIQYNLRSRNEKDRFDNQTFPG